MYYYYYHRILRTTANRVRGTFTRVHVCKVFICRPYVRDLVLPTAVGNGVRGSDI